MQRGEIPALYLKQTMKLFSSIALAALLFAGAGFAIYESVVVPTAWETEQSN
jgi:hypothetical protein